MSAISTLKRWFSSSAWQRGERYFESGSVLDLTYDDDGGLWVAEVLGSNYDSYEVLIRSPLDAVSKAECTCPVGYACKHIVAALLAIDEEDGCETLLQVPETPPHTQSETQRSVKLWLDGLTKAARVTPKAPMAVSMQATDLRFDLQLKGARSLPEFAPHVTYINKNGEISKRKPRKLGVGALHDMEVRTSAPAEAKRWLREIELIRASLPGFRSHAVDTEVDGLADLVLEIARAGKLHWGGVQTPPLTVLDACEVRLEWSLLADGTQSARLELQPGESVTIIETEPALWICKSRRLIGALNIGVPAEVLRMLSEAPPLRVDDLIEVEKALNHLQVPKSFWPKTVNRRTISGASPVPRMVLSGVPGRSVGSGRQGHFSYGWRPLTVPAMTLAFNYGGELVPADGQPSHTFAKDGEILSLTRDTVAERAAIAKVVQAGGSPSKTLKTATVTTPEQPGAFYLEPPKPLYQFSAEAALSANGRRRRTQKSTASKMVLTFERGEFSYQDVDPKAFAFVSESLPRLQALNWDILVHPSWPLKTWSTPSDISAKLETAGADGLRLGLSLERNGTAMDLAPLVSKILGLLPIDANGALPKGFNLEAALADTEVLVQGGPGDQASIDPKLLAKIIRGMLDNLTGLQPFHPAEAGRYHDFAKGLADSGVSFAAEPGLLDRAQRLQRLIDRVAAPPPAAFKGELRPYQLVGFNWLKTLRDTQFGGVLADDMGLGKTIEALAFLADLHLDQRSALPSLVIAPTSVVGAWRRAAEQFTPELKLKVLHGIGRHGQLEMDELAHVYVTTYALLHRDRETLTSKSWACVIADEAQAAKNPASNVAKRLRELTADTRLAVTGTPVENNLNDLWSLFDWAVPGLLGNREQFRKLYRTPIEKSGSQSAQAQLNARTKPFVLRRTKEEVATDLPLKTEITEAIAMSEAQQVLYESVRLAMDAKVRKIIASKGMTASHISILAALLQLRQVCCDPRLLKTHKTHPPASAKFERLFEMLEGLLAEGRRVVVFSQFVEMLKLIRAEVQARKWRHHWLDGATTQREKVVDAFQSGDSELFLISLKAGGAGITLTAADTVILYDPWWNPQVERQAMDRVHRIGQDKPVFVYRLVTEGTVEQAIHQLQAKKQALADALLEGGSTKGATLTAEDIDLLFSPIEMKHKSTAEFTH